MVDLFLRRESVDIAPFGAIPVAAGFAGTCDHALVSLLALNGLRVSEALDADIDDLAMQRSHRTLTVARKGAKARPR